MSCPSIDVHVLVDTFRAVHVVSSLFRIAPKKSSVSLPDTVNTPVFWALLMLAQNVVIELSANA